MSTSSRFRPGPNQDNTLQTVTQDYQAPAYAATIAIVPTQEKTLVVPGTLTGNLAFNVGVGGAGIAPFVGDQVTVLFAATGADRTVTLGAGIAPSAGTIVVTAAKYASLTLRFNGVKWVEVARAVTV